MKLFMEINPQLFDDCSHEYTELQSTADLRQQARQSKWDKLAEQARNTQNGKASVLPPSTTSRGTKATTQLRVDEMDPMTQDSQKRLDALKLQDESSNPREHRRPKDQENQNSVCIS